MRKKKRIDCVALKDEVQKRLRKDLAGLTDEEERTQIKRELATSDDIVARKWRVLLQRAREQAGPDSR